MILAEQDDEWQDGRCYFRPETMAANVLAGQQEVGQGAPDGELIRSGARTTRCYTTCWDLTAGRTLPAADNRICSVWLARISQL